jgi:hypothetical protein
MTKREAIRQTTMALRLDPGAVYSTLDAAFDAASCLAGLSESGQGCVIYCATTGPDITEESGEAYRVSVDARQKQGARWDAGISSHYRPCYRVQRLEEQA